MSHARARDEVVGETDVDDPQDARVLGAGHQDRAELRRAERDRQLAREPPRPRPRRSPRSRRRGCRRPRSARRPRSGSRSPPPSRPRACRGTPSRRSHPRRRPRERAPAGGRARGRSARGCRAPRRGVSRSTAAGSRSSSGILEEDHGRPHTPAAELPRGDQSVAAVVALPADDDRSAAVGTPGELAGRPRHGAAGPLHQDLRRDTARLRLAVERRGLLRREDRLHRTAIANATAFVFSWVNVISTSVTPSASARRFALPSSRIAGAPDGWRVTLMSCHRRPR